MQRLGEGIQPPQIDAEIAAWPLPRTSLLGTRDGDEAGPGDSGERSRVPAADSTERTTGRRRRRRSSSEDAPPPEEPVIHSPRNALDDDEPVPDEDAVIAAFTAGLESHAGDDD